MVEHLKPIVQRAINVGGRRRAEAKPIGRQLIVHPGATPRWDHPIAGAYSKFAMKVIKYLSRPATRPRHTPDVTGIPSQRPIQVSMGGSKDPPRLWRSKYSVKFGRRKGLACIWRRNRMFPRKNATALGGVFN
jgi:hypothetical protein